MKMIKKFKDKEVIYDESCYIADSAEIMGDVVLKKDVSVFYHSVIRGDSASIFIDEESNIQDLCVLHCDNNHPVHIGKRVSVGHRAIIHGASIDDETLIGMGAIVLNGAKIGKHCIIGANALVSENMVIEDGSVVVGIPAKKIKNISEKQIENIIHNAKHYVELGKEHKYECK